MIDISTMKTATVADLRNHFRRVSAWIENGETVEIIKRGRTFARLVPPTPPQETVPEVDWAAQRKAIWGTRVFSATEVKAMEDYEQEREEG